MAANDAAQTPANELPKPQVTIADAGPARKSLTIEIPAERIQAKLEESYKTLQNDAQIPGFRKGRAPRRLIEKRFGDSIRDDVRSQLISEAYTQVIEDQKLEVIGQPEIKDADKIKLPDSGTLSFQAEVEVAPSFELPNLEGIEIKKPQIEVKDADIAAEIERLRERMGKMQPVAEATVSAGDWMLADVRIVAGENAPADAAEIVHHPGAYILVPGADRANKKGNVIGIVVEDLDAKLTGKKAGDVVSFSMTGPAGHENEKIKSQPITFHVRVEAVERLQPAAVEDVLKQFGMENAEALNTRVKEMLESRREQTQRGVMHEQLTAYLMDQVKMDLPAGLSARQTARLLHRQAVEMAMRGTPEPEIEQRLAELRAGSEQAAQKQLKQFFVLERAAKQLSVEVQEAEVNGAITMMAMQQGRRPEKLRQEMIRNGRIEQVYLEARDAKTLDKILEKAKIVDVATVEEARPKQDDSPASEAAPAKESKKSTKKAEKTEVKAEATEAKAEEAKPKKRSKKSE